MSTRGALEINGKYFYIAHDSYPGYAMETLNKAAKHAVTPEGLIKAANKIYGGAKSAKSARLQKKDPWYPWIQGEMPKPNPELDRSIEYVYHIKPGGEAFLDLVYDHRRKFSATPWQREYKEIATLKELNRLNYKPKKARSRVWK